MNLNLLRCSKLRYHRRKMQLSHSAEYKFLTHDSYYLFSPGNRLQIYYTYPGHDYHICINYIAGLATYSAQISSTDLPKIVFHKAGVYVLVLKAPSNVFTHPGFLFSHQAKNLAVMR